MTTSTPDGRRNALELTPFPLQVAASIGWRLLIVLAALYALVWGLSHTAEIVIPIMVAILLTSLLQPIAKVLRGIGLPPYLAAGVTLLVLFGILGGLTTLAGTSIVNGFAALQEQARAGLAQVQEWLITGPLNLGGAQVSDAINQAEAWLRENQASLASGALSAGGTAISFGAGAVIALVSAFFFLADGGRIWGWFVRLLPRWAGEPLHEAMRRAWVSVGSYSKAQMVVALVDAVGIAAGAWILGLPLVIPIGILVALGAFIPIVGAVISGGVAVLLALVVKGPVTALIMLAIVIGVQQIEAHVVSPLLMSKAVELHPWAIIIGVALGSYVAGLVGALFAVPVMAMINTAVLYLHGQDRFPDLGTDELVFQANEKATTERPTSAEDATEDGAAEASAEDERQSS